MAGEADDRRQRVAGRTVDDGIDADRRDRVIAEPVRVPAEDRPPVRGPFAPVDGDPRGAADAARHSASIEVAAAAAAAFANASGNPSQYASSTCVQPSNSPPILFAAPGEGAAWVWLQFTRISVAAHPMASTTADRIRSANAGVIPIRSAPKMTTVEPPSRATSARTSSGSRTARGATGRRTNPMRSTGSAGDVDPRDPDLHRPSESFE